MYQFQTFEQWLYENGYVSQDEFYKRMKTDGFSEHYISKQWETVKETYLNDLVKMIKIAQDDLFSIKLQTEKDYLENDKKQEKYTKLMNRLFEYLQTKFNFTQDEFYDLQDQALLM